MDLEDLQVMQAAGVIEKPKTSGKFYFNYAGAWVLLELFKVIPIKNIENLVNPSYVLIYFTSIFPLPNAPKGDFILSSPLGLLSVPLYLNHKHPIHECFIYNSQCKIIKFSCFPGSEGAFCAGNIIIPSNIHGYAVSYLLPKL